MAWAQIQTDGTLVVAVYDERQDFHPDIVQVDALGIEGVAVGWHYDAGLFTPPPAPAPASKAELHAYASIKFQVAVMQGRVSASGFTNVARVSGAAGNPGTGGAVKSAIVANKSTLSSGGWDLWLFSANPTGSTCTNAAAWSLAAADIGKVIGVINFNAGNTSAAGTVFLPSSIAGNGNSSLGSGIWYALSSSTSMYGCLVARASMAVGTTTDLSISLMTNRL